MRKPSGLAKIAAFLLFATGAAVAQTDSADLAQAKPRPFSLELRTSGQMDAEDTATLNSRQADLVRQARFYGYDLTNGDWSIEQAICPLMPDTLMLHYLARQPQGTESLFTALVPRGASQNDGRIWIVPIYYRNATPYHPAARNKRNYEVFNQVVPSALAGQAVQQNGNWLPYAACYAEMVGGHPHVAMYTDPEDKTLQTTAPFISLSKAFKVQQIRFADRVTGDTTEVWALNFSPTGRVIDASNSQYKVQPPVPQQLAEPLPVATDTPAMPQGKILHPSPPPPS